MKACGSDWALSAKMYDITNLDAMDLFGQVKVEVLNKVFGTIVSALSSNEARSRA